MKIYTYDLRDGWNEVEDFIYDDDTCGLDEGLEKAGYEKSKIGGVGMTDTFFQTEVYIKKNSPQPYKYILSADLHHHCETIAVTDFPSFVEILAKLASINQASSYGEIEEERMLNEIS